MSDEIRVYMFEGGLFRQPLRNVNSGQGLSGEMVTTPVTWFLITHPRGCVIVDGGNAPEVAVDVKAHWGAITEQATITMTPDQAVVPSLERIGIDLSSIRWIVQTHLHIDHTGAVAVIDRLPNAQVLATRTEYEWAHAPDSLAEMFYCKADFMKARIDWALLDETDDGYDLFGDGTLRCWRTPGHTPGHQSIELHLASGSAFMLTGDAANSIDQLEERAFPAFAISSLDAIRSVRKLRRLVWRAQALAVASHDLEQWGDLRHAPEYYD